MTSKKLLTIALLPLAAPAVAAPVDPAGLPLPLYCYGGEPFWSLTIRDTKTAEFKSDIEKTTWTIKSVGHAMLRPTTWRVIFNGEGRRALIFDEGQQACSDSDGERPRAYGLLLEDGEGFLRGCCDPKP